MADAVTATSRTTTAVESTTTVTATAIDNATTVKAMPIEKMANVVAMTAFPLQSETQNKCHRFPTPSPLALMYI